MSSGNGNSISRPTRFRTRLRVPHHKATIGVSHTPTPAEPKFVLEYGLMYAAAPPGYSSPDPNAYPYQQDVHNDKFHPHAAAGPISWKPQHPHRAPEVLGETMWRGELDSLMPSPRLGSGP